MRIEDKKFYKPQDVAALMGIGRDKTYTLFHRKDFPAQRFGHIYLVERTAFEQWLISNRGTKIQ